MLLSVIIPAFNAQSYLNAAVRSLRDQACQKMEIILIDDGSTDATPRIADTLAGTDPLIRVIHSPNRGVSHARNLGLESASGDYIAFLDADDVWCPQAMDSQTDALLSSGKYDILSFGYMNADPDLRFGKPNPESDRFLLRQDPQFNHAAERKPLCSYVIRRALVQNIRFPDGIRYNEDTTFLFLVTRLAENMLCLNRYLFAYRNHLHSAMHAMTDWSYILTDEIAAWAWARQQTAAEKDRQDCDGMVYSLMAEYLRLSALWGADFRQLKEAVRTCAPFQDTAARFGHFWIRDESVVFLTRFSRDPERLCLTYRLRGILPKAARALARTQVLRRVYFRLKYRTRLADFFQKEVPPVPQPVLKPGATSASAV